MKSVLISIQPKWCELIASGKKTVEIRKTRPKIETPFKCYIYETKGEKRYFSQPLPIPFYEGNGKVIGEFVCDKIDYWQYVWESDVMHIQDMSKLSCVSVDDLLEYANYDEHTLYAWHISDLVIYDKPKELMEFNHCGVNYHFNPPITRPPQSWCYVERKEDEKNG